MDLDKEQLLDLNIIQGLKDLSDDDSFFLEIIDLYKEQYPQILNSIKSTFSNNDLQGLSKASHALKGASLNIGAKELAAVCKTLEINSKSGINEGLDTLISQIENLYIQTINEIEKL